MSIKKIGGNLSNLENSETISASNIYKYRVQKKKEHTTWNIDYLVVLKMTLFWIPQQKIVLKKNLQREGKLLKN